MTLKQRHEEEAKQIHQAFTASQEAKAQEAKAKKAAEEAAADAEARAKRQQWAADIVAGINRKRAQIDIRYAPKPTNGYPSRRQARKAAAQAQTQA